MHDNRCMMMMMITIPLFYERCSFLFYHCLVPCNKWLDLTIERNYTPVHKTCHFFQGTRKTQSCLTGHPVWPGVMFSEGVRGADETVRGQSNVDWANWPTSPAGQHSPQYAQEAGSWFKIPLDLMASSY